MSRLLKGLLKERLEGQAYDPVLGSQLAKQMAGAEGGALRVLRAAASTSAPHKSMPKFPTHRPTLSLSLFPAADDIREQVKALGFDRHKLVVHVTIGERRRQALSSCSRCQWDTAADGFASESLQTETLFCTAQVYALYFE